MSKTVNRAELLKRLSPAQRALLLKELQKEAAQTNGGHDIPRRPQAGPVPLSFSQQRLWFLSQVDPDSPLYNVPELLSLQGQLNVAALEQSFNEIIRRQESLRTVFKIVERQPVQICTPARPLSLRIIDLTNLPPAARELCARRLVDTEARRPFNLTNDVLWRVTLLRLDDEHHWAILTLHHIVADGWSVGLLIREMIALYKAFAEGHISPLSELSIQYTDFTQWQREWLQGERLASQLEYWKQHLDEAPPLQLPTDRPRSAQTTLAGVQLNFTIPPTLSEAVKRLSEREGVTLFMTLLAAFKVLLYRYTQQRDIVVGTAIANRHHGETENLIGFFVNILLLRTNLSAELTFRDLLQRVKEVALAAFEHQDVPFDKLVEELQPERQLNRHPFFQVVFAVHSGLAPTLNLHELRARQLPATSQTSKYDLSLEFVDTEDALTGFLEYSTELFDTETIERFLDHYQTLLASIVKNPAQSIASLQLLPQAERRKLLEWNSDRSFPVDRCLHELIAAQVEQTPDVPALTFDNQLITYRQLDDRANQLAHYLRTLGVGPDVLVSIFMERSVEMMVGLLAVLKAGGAYVPIDPAYPPDRIRFILEDTAAPVLLTQQSMSALLPSHNARVVCLGEQQEEITTEPLTANVSPDNLAYIIYTSGSTGKPKGVMVTHRNVVRLFAATQDSFAFDKRDVWTLFHSYAFDFSVWEMWGALLYGGRLVIVPYWVSRSPDAFYEMLVRERVTVLNQTPSAFRQLCQIDEVSKREVQQSLALRLVIFGGEALDYESLGQWFRDHGDEQPQLVNMYGITETTVHVTERRVRAADLAANVGSLIGRPISDLRGYVLDQQMELLPAGVPGELYVGGAGVARGYLWRPELSAERFVPDPFTVAGGARLYRTGDLVRYRGQNRSEGELEYLGRVDQQVKIRGFRIEPGEIESALEQHEEVLEAVVIASDDVPGEPRLIAYIVPEPNHDEHDQMIDSAELSAEQVAQWEMVFNENYSQPANQSDPTFNISGWNNSYTGKPIAEEEMREWLDQTIARILSLQPRRVLEIGCGTGLLLLRVAPFCTRYVGTDFSSIALDYIQQTLSLRNEDLPQLELRHSGADNFEGFEPNSFDLVILNSVVQYFPSIDYLLRVIEGAVRVVRPGGSIFIGDVRSLPLLEAFHLSVQLYQAPGSLPVAQLEQRVKRHMAQEEELIIEPAFFAALKQHLPEIGDVHALLKHGRYHNEMTQFRYDVVLRLGEPEEISLSLTQSQSEISADLPVFQSLKALELLAGDQRPETVNELRELLQQIDSIDSEEVGKLLSLTNGNLKPWARYANNPLEGRFARRLVPKLRSFLHEQLPDYMVPSAFVLMDVMPLTQHGKINRRALPAPDQTRPELEDIYVAPRTPIEKDLAAMFAHVLGVTQVGLHDNFFDLGGHSLLATQLLSHIRDIFSDKDITLRDIFELQTVAGLAGKIESTGVADQNLPPLLPVPRNVDLPLSFAQQRLWFLDQLEPGTAVYNCPAAVRFHGALNIAALEQSFNEVVRRHEVLRTSFASRDGYPLQVIAASLHVPLPVIDLSGLPAERLETEIQRLSVLEAKRAFDLSHGALLRMKLLRASAAEHVVLVTMHHIISDGWSTGVLVREVATLYSTYAQGTAGTLAPLPVQYADYAYWEREWLQGAVLEEQLAYWKQQLAGAPVLELPSDRPRSPVQSYRGAYESFHLGKELSRGLNELSRQLDVTLFMILLAAWQTLLHRYSGQREIVIGSPIANRHRSETEALVGFFVNTLALRTDLSGDPTFAEVLQRVRETALRAYAYQALPFEKLIEELQPERDASHTPLVPVVFSLQNTPQADLAALDLALNYVEVQTGTTKFDLVIDMEENDEGLSLSFRYSTDLFDVATMQQLAQHFETLVGTVIEDAHKRISELQFLSDAEQRRLLIEPNATARSYPADKCVHELFAEQVERSPEAIALVCDGIEITYAELEKRAELLAGYFNARGIGVGSRVGIFLDHSIETVVAILGVLRTGAAYVPMDTDHPRTRLAFIIEDAQLETLLAQQSLIERLPLTDRVQVILMDSDEWQCVATEGHLYKATSADTAYVIYTSGSTGQPKGVQISHRALVNYLSWCRDVYVKNEEASFALYSSLAFDLTVTSIFTPLLTGNRLVIYGRANQFAVQRIVQDNLVDVLKLTPSHLALIKDFDNRNSRLKRLIVGGESLSTELATQVHESFGGQVEILNEYGPTEATVGCMIYRFDPQRDQRIAVPIGRPAANVQIYVLDEHLNPTPENVIGELYISGAGLAEGYLNRPDLTAERFIPHPLIAGQRMYRSGDRARWVRSGEIEYLGRGDEQVKYHGYRIELSEISSALNLHPQVRNSVVLLRPDHRGEDTLVAYYVARREIETAVLREFLRDHLIAETIPNVFMHLTRMPLTLNGKVDYRALPELQAMPRRQGEYVAPRTVVEEVIADIWSNLLGLERVSLHDNFFELGGHSLIATQVMVRVQKTTGVELPLRSLFESPTVAQLAAQIEAALRKGAVSSSPPIVPVARDRELPLSFAQQRLWFLDQLEPGKATYNCPAAVRFTGALNIAALAQSFNEVVRRHEVLRTRFRSRDGSPVQIIAPSLQMPLPLIDLSGLPVGNLEAEIERLSRLEAQRGFDLSQDVLLRAKVLRASVDEHVVVVTMHHIVSDGWSVGVLVKEVAALYEAYAKGDEVGLKPLAVQYADYAHWEREWLQGEVLEEQMAYWKEQLAEAPVLELPTDRPRPPVPSYRGAFERFALAPELSAGLLSLSRRLDATLFMTLFAAWQTLLHRYSGQNDIVVGTPIANRQQAETEDLIGFFVNMLPLRTDLSGNPTFAELVQRVRETALGAYAHQALPFEKLIEELQPERDASHSPLVQVVFALQNAPQGDLTSLDLKLNYVPVDTGTAMFELIVNMQESKDGLLLSFIYSTDLFDSTTIGRLKGHFETLLAAVVADPGKRLSKLNLLSDKEHDRLVIEANATETSYPTDKCAHQLFEEQVARSPEAIALVADGRQITYAELQRQADLLARHLQQRGIGRGSYVGIFLDHSIETIVAILGVLRAGATYVPLDTDHPRTRLAFIIEDARLEAVLAQERLIERLPLNGGVPVILMDSEDWQRAATEGQPYESTSVVSADAAYVIYTSGSTGQPKGVKISHRALVNYLSWCRDVYVKNEEVSFALYSSLAFDLTVTSIFTPLLTGNRLVIYGRANQFAVPRIMEDNLVDVLKLTPSHLALIKDFDNRNSRLKRLIVGGESLSTELAAQVHQSFGGRVEILNEYGPTEATVGCMIYRYDAQRDRRSAVPIGRPAANVQIYVLDEHLNPTPENVIGELYIGGAGLADGYVNRAELTAEKFIANPFVVGQRMYRSGDRARWLASGELEYLGRGDEQVKYHGYRIELSEISSALNQHPQVRNSVVLLRKDHRGEDTLVAYYVSRREIETAVLREFLLDHLIKETIPNVFIHLTRMPLTLNGKVDYRALPELQESKQRRGKYVVPRTVVEEVVADIWANLLGLPRVSLHDNFFELGGHSLIATQVMVRVQKTTGVELPLRTLFENPTVAQLAGQIEKALRKGTASPAPPLVHVACDGELPLSFAQQRLWFLHQLEPDKPTYNCSSAMRLTGKLNLPALHQSLNEIVRRHEVLRTAFDDVDGRPVPRVTKTSALRLKVIDLQMVDPAQREQQVLRLARADADRPFDLSQPPPLLRVTLVRLDQQEQVVLFTMHHIICDAWSIALLMKEVMRLYGVYSRGTPSPLPELEIQYSDYAMWQRQWLQGEALEEKLTAWERQFGDDPPLLELPVDEWCNTGMPARAAKQQLVLSRELSQALRVLGQRESATLFMTMLAAFECLLHRYTGQVDMVVGTGVANRNRSEIEELIGFFVNMLVMRTDLSGNPTFKQLLARVREATLAAFAFENLPFEKLVETLHPDRNVAGTSLLKVVFWHQSVPMTSFSLEGLTFTPLELNNEMIYFDLMAEIVEGEEGLAIRLSYNTNQFNPETIARLLTQYEALLQCVVDQPEGRLLDIPVLLTEPQKGAKSAKAKVQSSSFSLRA